MFLPLKHTGKRTKDRSERMLFSQPSLGPGGRRSGGGGSQVRPAPTSLLLSTPCADGGNSCIPPEQPGGGASEVLPRSSASTCLVQS